MRCMQAITELIHHPYQPPEGFAAPQPGVFKASTILFPNVAAMRSRRWKDRSGYTYGLHGTPSSYVLEERVAALEGGTSCTLAPSGLAALALVNLALLEAGDQVLLPDNVYDPNKEMAEGQLAAWGISHAHYNPLDAQDLARKITPQTRLVWMEAAGSVTMEFPDLIGLVKVCRARGVVCALDSTWAAGQAYHAFDLDGHGLGVDVAAHALTKYPSGGSDVLAGSIVTRDAELHARIQACHMHLGINVGSNDVELLLRSLPSIALRYQRQDQSARVLARWCAQQPQFAQVLHPALADAPGHAYWQQVCGAADARGDGAAAGLFSVVVDSCYTEAQVDAFCDGLELFKLGYSWGGPVSLAVPYRLSGMRESWPAHVARGTVVRLATGLEAVADLQADLAQSAARTLPM